jgi:hypothetical protein
MFGRPEVTEELLGRHLNKTADRNCRWDGNYREGEEGMALKHCSLYRFISQGDSTSPL